ncbi:MAG: hypothetical protein HYU85_05025 [Chloroflexi bacterium]|nr:hypothetical protein [Chloroflexota bacterium]
MIEEHMPWPWLILGILDDHDGQASLQEIYFDIDDQYHENKPEGTELINPALLKVSRMYGERFKYTHTVRGCLSNYVKRGLVEHVGKGRTGIYRITDVGLNRLTWYQKHY